MLRALLLLALAAGIAYKASQALQQRSAHLSSQLPPAGSGNFLKDLAAYALVSLPRLVRVATTGTSTVAAAEHAAALEGYHARLQLNPVASNVDLQASSDFAENYYIWAGLDNSTEFVLSTRLSFYGRGGSHVVPWFSFYWKGSRWNLPDDFEASCLPHNHASDPRVAKAPGLGELFFELVTPLKRWKVLYSGLVQNEDTGAREQVDAEFTIDFRPSDVFLYQIHWDELAAALAMSMKPWTPEFFNDLRAQNQERYASRSLRASGHIVFAKDQTKIELPRLLSSRDHNWGIRNWLYIYRYLWWPPIHFAEPIVIEGVEYTSFTGSLVEYGRTFSDLVVGGLVSDDGHCAAFSGATSMRDIAPEWFRAKSARGVGIGEKLVPATQKLTFGVLQAKYALDVTIVKRGEKSGLWEHSFMLIGGDFEINEALTLFQFSLRRMGDNTVVQTTTAQGLWEFGAPLVEAVA